MPSPIFWTLVLCVLAISIPHAFASSFGTQIPRSSYGEVCNKSQKCDSRAWLGCYNGHCDCIKQEEMIYEEDVKKCVSKSGERCTFALDDVEDNNFIFEVTGCISNARCSPEGVCLCGNKFFEDENGTCTPAFGHLESCESHSQCSRYQGLLCQDGRCQCNASTAVYSAEDTQCVGLGDQQCINSKCTEDSICVSNTCSCDDEFFVDDDGYCAPKVSRGENCTNSDQCQQFPTQRFVCLKGKCDCDPSLSVFASAQAATKYSDSHGFYESWDNEKQAYYYTRSENINFHGYVRPVASQCVGLSSFPCIDRLCAPNAFCSYPIRQEDRSSSYDGICQCMSGFTESKSRTCATGYKTSCSKSSTCIDGLVCRNSVCLCPYETQTFDSSRKTCSSQVGGPCSENSSCQPTWAECIIPKIGSQAGNCACKAGYVENLTGKCEAAFGTKCSSATDCDTYASLQCIDQKCQCPLFAVYNSALRKCVGLAGAKCDINKRDETECTKNSECTKHAFPKFPGSCTCKPGFEKSENYTCEASTWDSVNEL